MTIHEPATFATDIALALLAAHLAWRLGGAARRPGLAARRWWALALAATSVAALAGGFWHGFRPYLPWLLERGLWKVTLVAAGVTSFGLVAASSFAGLTRGARRGVLGLAAAGGVGYLAWISLRDDFMAVVLASGIALLVVAAVHLRRWNEPGSAPILAGVAVALAGGIVQAFRLAPHPSFNHNDLYHVIEMVALVLFFRGARRLLDRSN